MQTVHIIPVIPMPIAIEPTMIYQRLQSETNTDQYSQFACFYAINLELSGWRRVVVSRVVALLRDYQEAIVQI